MVYEYVFVLIPAVGYGAASICPEPVTKTVSCSLEGPVAEAAALPGVTSVIARLLGTLMVLIRCAPGIMTLTSKMQSKEVYASFPYNLLSLKKYQLTIELPDI